MSLAQAGIAAPGRFPASNALPPGDGFLDAVTAEMLARIEAAAGEQSDLSAWLVLAPSLPIAAELRQSFIRVIARPVMLPRFDVLSRWEQSEPLAGLPAALPDSERLALLHEALRQRGWFDDGARWAIAGELAVLFDELTAAAVVLPDDDKALAAQLADAYALRVSEPLAFEARLVVELWRALAAVGRPDLASQRRLRLARLAAQAARPLLVLLDAAPEEALDAAESEFLLRWGERQPLAVYHPAPRAAGATALQSVLAAAWPEMSVDAAADAPTDAAPLAERAAQLQSTLVSSPLAGRLQLVAATGRETEAEAAVAQVLNWIDAGCRRIALISQDRLTARRVRALLERENVLVADETGWKLSTSRAAACVDALLETVAGNAYHRDLLDLLKSPFVFADLAPADEGAAPAATGKVKEAAVFTLEAALRAASARNGLPRIRRALREHAGDGNAAATAPAQQLLDRVEAAATLLADRPAPLARWIERLQKALDALGACAALAADPAGQALFTLLETRRDELAANAASFAFASFRDWLNREFEAGSFRDASISSPIVLTPLNAVALRRFDAAIVLGGDARQLSPGEGGSFFNAAVRRELGLRTHDEAQREMRRDLELLLASVPRVVVVWQSEIDGEANLLAPEFDLLSALHALAWNDDLRRAPLSWGTPAVARSEPDTVARPRRAAVVAPVAPAALLPQRITVSAYASLVACPYRFFARHVLGLGEVDEVLETVGKRDYGALVHRVLEIFHAGQPLVSALDPAAARAALLAITDEVFAPAIEENALALGWCIRWRQRIDAYLDWQRQREAAGWRWRQAETPVRRQFVLADGSSLELRGRIDRIDRRDDGCALLDYKTQSVKTIRDTLADDLQLPAYALLCGAAAIADTASFASESSASTQTPVDAVVEAAYVALDDDAITALAAADGDAEALQAAAQAHGERLVTAFAAMRAGAPLPAHGVEAVCRWCEMAGLCRREHG
ncbi:PD-(D/E)XK nuclease family protein [Rhodocyclus tenuis]|uniref:PD-(D/E)XK nuclease family protein n=1 Tax=Rhodocyclus tenuis TaxID=1066 RepID=UPI001904AC58|nr:PD-(D/E)XK nuclease family protein [Rhodocyclus tenuis]MBK1679406.1 Inactivated superfamily I helicase [Rhodocyclus tenuis]